MKKLLFMFVIIFANISVYATKKPANIIFIIGDGMGLPQITAGMLMNGNHSSLEKCTSSGFIKTSSFDNNTTDSGAGGTALSSGIKTKNGMIGMGPDSVAFPSLMKICKEHGFSTGLVVTCAVTHATPATFVAHQINRNMYEEIAADYLQSDIDFIAGGGRKYFSNRSDNRNLINELKEKKYKILQNPEELYKLRGNSKTAALVFDEHAPAAPARKDFLPEASRVAINQLEKNRQGFFLMIEASQIDWACHANDSAHLVNEMLDFEKTVATVLQYAEKRGNTLVIITADHETGGLSIQGGDYENGKIKMNFSTKSHTPTPVPVFAYGPGAENFGGIHENTFFRDMILKLLEFK